MIVDASLQLKTSVHLGDELNLQKEEVLILDNALQNDFPELFYARSLRFSATTKCVIDFKIRANDILDDN